MISQDAEQTRNARYSMIDAIVRATAQMAETRTGALIILERDTKLGELAEQENAVIMDSVVSASMLLQIFYKGSPLHDGAVLIREGRISAARCHVPLSDNYHLRRDYGTRHRAAIGVSEMGDAIAIAVSEERGVVSIAINGRLYTLDNTDALRTILHRQLGVKTDSRAISDIFKTKKTRKSEAAENSPSPVHPAPATGEYADGDIDTYHANNEAGEKTDIPYRRKWILEGHDSVRKLSRKNKILLLTSSLMISVFLWLYILITVNPVETKEFNVNITVQGSEQLADRDLELDLAVDSVKINVAGRSQNLKKLSSGDIEAAIDVSDITTAGTFSATISIRVRKLAYFEIREIYPARISAETINSDG
jgi:hypothetical protein